MKFVIDENFDNDILSGVLLRRPLLNFVRIQDVGLRSQSDADVLEFAGREGRVVLTHDVKTVYISAYERVANGLPMPGVFEVPQQMPIRHAIEEILLLEECSLDGEWEG